MLVKMVDGGIINVDYDSESWGGCETCDYGSRYINEFTVEMTSGKIEIKTTKMYDYALSEGYMMETLLKNIDDIKAMTEYEFYRWIESKIKSDTDHKWDGADVDVEFYKRG